MSDRHEPRIWNVQFRRLIGWQYFPFVLLALFFILFYLFATGRFGDDVDFYTNNPLKDGLFNRIIDQYYNWSSRIIILPVSIALCLAPITVWRALDLAVWLLLGVCVSKLFVKNPKTNYFLAGCMALYPYWHIGTAGWITTTCNYSWPLAFGLFVFLTIKRLYENVRLPWYRYVLCALAFLYATDAEQMCAVTIVVLAYLTILRYFRHKEPNAAYSGIIVVLLILTIARLAFTLTTPGNQARLISSYHLIPEFVSYSLFDKLALGFDFTITHYLVCTLGLFPLFSLLLTAAVWRGHKGLPWRCVSAVPFASSVVFTIYAGIRALSYFRELLVLGRERGFANAIFVYVLLPSATGMRPFFIIFFLCVLFSLYCAFKKRKDALTAIGITLLGFGSQMLLGFSPSIYGSALRTFIFASFGVIICAVRLYENLSAERAFCTRSKLIFLATIAGNYAITFAVGQFKLGGP